MLSLANIVLPISKISLKFRFDSLKQSTKPKNVKCAGDINSILETKKIISDLQMSPEKVNLRRIF